MRRSLRNSRDGRFFPRSTTRTTTRDFLKAQVLEYRLEGKAKLIVRPSGTEPKIKVYLSAVGKTREEADSVIETMKQTANELMKA